MSIPDGFKFKLNQGNECFTTPSTFVTFRTNRLEDSQTKSVGCSTGRSFGFQQFPGIGGCHRYLCQILQSPSGRLRQASSQTKQPQCSRYPICMDIPCSTEEVTIDYNGCAVIQESPCDQTTESHHTTDRLAVCTAVCSSQCRLPSREVRSRQSSSDSIRGGRRATSSMEPSKPSWIHSDLDGHIRNNLFIEAITLQNERIRSETKPQTSLINLKDLVRPIGNNLNIEAITLQNKKVESKTKPSSIKGSRKINHSIKLAPNHWTLTNEEPGWMSDYVVEAIELQDNIVTRIHKRKSKSIKCTMYHYMAVILLFMMYIIPVLHATPLNAPALFDKDQVMDKLILRNQIAYHFKKSVREVTQELFVSRQLDVSILFLGIHVLKHTGTDLMNYCNTLKSTSSGYGRPTGKRAAPAPYVLIAMPALASFAEAKARCKARKMQLPEVYNDMQLDLLSSFLRANKLNACFAGLEPDIIDSIFRFISTGYPIWKTPHKNIYLNGISIPMDTIMDDANTKFMYTKNKELVAVATNSILSTKYNLGDPQFREHVKDFTQTVGAIVCEPAWDGITMDHFKHSLGPVGDTRIHTYPRRSVDSETSNKGKANSSVPTNKISDEETSNKGNSDSHIFIDQLFGEESSNTGSSDPPDFVTGMFNDGPPKKGSPRLSFPETLQEYCVSIANQASDISYEMTAKLKNLLSLVDISVQLEQGTSNTGSKVQRSEGNQTSETAIQLYGHNNNEVAVILRHKRFAFMAKFIFKTGVKLIWGLVGFIDKMRMKKRIGKIEKSLAKTQEQSQDNFDNIQRLSVTVSENSIAIDRLKITTAGLSNRIDILEVKVDSIISTIDAVADNVQDMLRLSLVANLISRIQQSMNTGYDTLKDIIHCSLLGQTSPLLLPADQIILVQNEVRQASTGILDTDFVRMQSIVVSDPVDPHLLLVVINVAALSRTELELVKLVSIPQYENGKSYSPTLDYDTIVVDQLNRKYFILTEQEEYDCLFDRCYISDVERSIEQKTCGIPQLFNQQLDACVYEETLTNNGVYIKPMLPDGIIFAFESEVSSQLFCKGSANNIGPPKKMNGTGIMQLPNGCVLSVTDKLGKNTKVKGQPLYRAIIAEEISLVINGPLSTLFTQLSKNDSQKKLTTDGILINHLLPVVQQVRSVDAKVEHQSLFIWGLIAVLSLAVIIIILVIYFQFKSFKQFFRKIYELRQSFANLGEQVLVLKEARDRLRRRLAAPGIGSRMRDAFHLGSHHRFQDHALNYPDGTEDDLEGYAPMDHLMPAGGPIPAPRAPPVNLPENTTSSFKLPRRQDMLPMVPYPSLSQPLLDQLDLERECKEVATLCKKISKKPDENDYSK